jgi:hypothetical protein
MQRNEGVRDADETLKYLLVFERLFVGLAERVRAASERFCALVF